MARDGDGQSMSAKLPLTEVEEAVTPYSSPVSPPSDIETSPIPSRPLMKWRARIAIVKEPIVRLHQRTPYLRRVPAFVFFPITILTIVNCVVWAIVGIILAHHL